LGLEAQPVRIPLSSREEETKERQLVFYSKHHIGQLVAATKFKPKVKVSNAATPLFSFPLLYIAKIHKQTTLRPIYFIVLNINKHKSKY
jgi:tryptophanyl-tRNA synthetase